MYNNSKVGQFEQNDVQSQRSSSIDIIRARETRVGSFDSKESKVGTFNTQDNKSGTYQTTPSKDSTFNTKDAKSATYNTSSSKVPVYTSDPTRIPVLDTRFFGSNLSTNLENKGYIAEAINACTDNKFAEIVASDNITLIQSSDASVENLNIQCQSFEGGTTMYQHYVSVFGHSLVDMDDYNTDHELDSRTVKEFRLEPIISIKINNTTGSEALVPVVPTYASLNMNLLRVTKRYATAVHYNNNTHMIIPFPSVTFPFISTSMFKQKSTIKNIRNRVSECSISTSIKTGADGDNKVTESDLTNGVQEKILTGSGYNLYCARNIRTNLTNEEINQLENKSIYTGKVKFLTIPQGVSYIYFDVQEVASARNTIEEPLFCYHAGDIVYSITPSMIKREDSSPTDVVFKHMYVDEQSGLLKDLTRLNTRRVLIENKKLKTTLYLYECTVNGSTKYMYVVSKNDRLYFPVNGVFMDDNPSILSANVIIDKTDETVINIVYSNGDIDSISLLRYDRFGLSGLSANGLGSMFACSIDRLGQNIYLSKSFGRNDMNVHDNSSKLAIVGYHYNPSGTGDYAAPFGRSVAIYNTVGKKYGPTAGSLNGNPILAISYPDFSGGNDMCFYNCIDTKIFNYMKPNDSYLHNTSSTFTFGNSAYAWTHVSNTKQEYGKYYALYTNGYHYNAHAEYQQNITYYKDSVSLPIILPLPVIIKNSDEYSLFVTPQQGGIQYFFNDGQPSEAYSVMSAYTLSLRNTAMSYNNFKGNNKWSRGSLILYNTLKHVIGGAYSDVETPDTYVGGTVSGKSLVYGDRDIYISGVRYIYSGNQLYTPFSKYMYMSTTENIYISEETINQDVLSSYKVGSYLFLTTEKTSSVYFDTKEGTIPVFSSKGEVIDSPVLFGQQVYFAIKEDSKVVIYAVTQLNVNNLYSFNRKPNDSHCMYIPDNVSNPILISSYKNSNGAGGFEFKSMTQYSLNNSHTITSINGQTVYSPSVEPSTYTGLKLDPIIRCSLGNKMYSFVANKQNNTAMSITSEYIKLAEFQGKSFTATGIEILMYSTGNNDSIPNVSVSNGQGLEYKAATYDDVSSIYGRKMIFTLDTPTTNPYLSYKIECDNVVIKDVILIGYLSEVNI